MEARAVNMVDSCGSFVRWEVGSDCQLPSPSRRIHCCNSSLCSPEAKGHTQRPPPELGAWDDAVLGGEGDSPSTYPAGQTSGKARGVISNTGGRWQHGALPGLLAPCCLCIVGMWLSSNEQVKEDVPCLLMGFSPDGLKVRVPPHVMV